MPFFYYLSIPNLESKDCGRENLVKVIHFLVKPRMWIGIDVPIASISCGEEVYEVFANGRGVLHRFLADEGSMLTIGENIAIIDAEGEDIPYSNPYSKARKIKKAKEK